MRHVIAKRDERAVAPVIAEILLVAMTVSIAGVVYLTANSFAIQASVSSRPYVGLMPASVQDGVATIAVAGSSWSAHPESYLVNLKVGSVLGHPVPLAAAGSAATLVVQGVTYRVSWSDPGNVGALVGGDVITIRAASAHLPADTAFTFYLIWSDGAVLQSVSWAT